MFVGVFDLFKIGIGPSSSHTVGPMEAARRFAVDDLPAAALERAARVRVELFGSLAYTGVGHGTTPAVLLGLEGARPDTVDPEHLAARAPCIAETKTLRLAGLRDIAFDPETDVASRKGERLAFHSNALRFSAFDETETELLVRVYYSIGGGFVVSEDEARSPAPGQAETPVPYPFDSAEQLLETGAREGLSIAEIMRANERALRTGEELEGGLARIWEAMEQCIARGVRTEGVLPGGLRVRRRAAALRRKLENTPAGNSDPVAALDWVNLWAMAVNEENAAGGRVVTAPTNGAAGIIPAVMKFYDKFYRQPGESGGIAAFLLTAAAIGSLYKKNASISGAEAGCQGEVGAACSMAAAGLAAALGGTNAQVENAAEIAMEHNLGLTCDPVGGLVQIPCIERNAMGAVKAIDACRLALHGDGSHMVSLDQVIRTMKETGQDMSEKYKETSTGGLAVNVPAC